MNNVMKLTKDSLIPANSQCQLVSQLFLETVKDILLVVRRNGTIIDANRAACRAYGYSRAELRALSIHQLRAVETHSDMSEQLRLASKKGMLFETIHQRKNGAYFPVEVNSQDCLVDNEHIMVCIIRDISARKQVEESSHRTNCVLKMLVAALQATVQKRDEKSLLQEVCRIIAEVGGYRLAWIGHVETEGTKQISPIAFWGFEDGYLASDKVTWADTPNGYGPIGVALRKRQPIIVRNIKQEISCEPWRTGAIMRGFQSTIALPVISGEVPVAIIVVYAAEPDAFDQEEVMLLLSLADNLGHALFSLRRQVASPNSKEIERLARLDLIGQMAASVGHEVRNPMTTVRGFLQMMLAKEAAGNNKEFYHIMIDELDRANRILSEFLSLAKEKTEKRMVMSLNCILETMYPLMNAEAIKNDQIILYELGNIPPLLLDESEVRQLFMNLVKNALEAMPKKGVVKVKTYFANQSVVLEVADSGGGIPQHVLHKLGTPFFTTKETGTGLGLPVCYGIAFRHNATIDIKTNESGTTFLVKFAICEAVERTVS